MQQRQGREFVAVGSHTLRWTPAYSAVAGDLQAADLPIIEDQRGLKFSYGRFDLRVSTPGDVAIGLSQRDGTVMWIGARLFETGLTARTTLNLPAGTHTITLSIDRARARDLNLRVELLDLPGSAARAQLVLGKLRGTTCDANRTLHPSGPRRCTVIISARGARSATRSSFGSPE